MINGMVNINRIGMSLGAVGLLLSSSTFAADYTFWDPNSSRWDLGGNWIGMIAPPADVDGSIFIQSAFNTGLDPAIPITDINMDHFNMNGLEFTSAGVDDTYDLQGTGSFTFNTGASITNSKTSNADVSVGIAGSSGTLTLDAANGSLGINSAVDLSAGTALTVTGSNDTEIDGIISGDTGSLIKTGSGTLTLTGTNTFTGGTTLNGGVTTVNSDDAFGTGSVTVAGASGLTAGISSVTLANTFTLNDTLTISGDNNLTLSGVISDGASTGALTKTGAGTLVLSGINTYSGGTTLSGGTVIAGSDSAFGDSTGSVTLNGAVSLLSGVDDEDGVWVANAFTMSEDSTLTVDGDLDLTLNANIFDDGDARDEFGNITANVGNGRLIKKGEGTLYLNGHNLYSGGTEIHGGVIVIAGPPSSDSNRERFGFGTVELMGDAEIRSGEDNSIYSYRAQIDNDIELNSYTLTTSNDEIYLMFAGDISGDGKIVHDGPLWLLLDGDNNTFTGGVTMNAGTLRVFNDGGLGTGDLTIDGASRLYINQSITLGNDIVLNADLELDRYATANLAGVISGDGALISDDGMGFTLTLSGDNTYTGGTIFDAGVLQVSHDNALGTGTFTVDTTPISGLPTDPPATASLGAGIDDVAIANDIVLETELQVIGSNDMTLDGDISGVSGLNKTDGDHTLTLTGTNTYSGGTNIDAGAIIAEGGNAIGDSSLVTIADVAGAMLQLNANETIGGLTGGGSTGGELILQANTLTIGGDDDTTFDGVVSGTGSLAITGTGTLTLTGTNTFTGGTTLNGGVTTVNSDDAFGTGSVTVAGASGLTAGISSVTLANTFTLNDTLTISGDNDLTLDGVVSGTGALIKGEAIGTLTLNNDNTYSGGTTHYGGLIQVGSDDALGSGALTVDGAAYDSELSASVSGVALDNAVILNDDFTVAGDNDLTLDGNISGTSGLTKTGDGTLTLNGYNSYSGDTTIAGGTIVLKGVNDAIANYDRLGTGTVNFTGDATLKAGEFPSATNLFSQVDNDVNLGNSVVTIDGNMRFLGNITDDDSGSGGGITINSGTVYLGSEANSFSGGITMNGGGLGSVETGTLGTGVITIDGDSYFHGNGTQEFDNEIELNAAWTVYSNTQTRLDGDISGDGSIRKTDDGVLTLVGDNTFAGGIAHAQGTIEVGSNNALGTGALTVEEEVHPDITKSLRAGSSGITVDNDVTLNGDLTVTGDNDLMLTGAIDSTGGLIKEGSSTLALSGTNTYTGDTTINAGTIIASGGNAIGDSSLVTIADVAGAMLQLNADETIGGLTGGGSTGGEVDLQNYILSISGADDTTFGGVISGTGSIAMTGTGTLTLTGANTFTGGTTLNGGVTTVNSDDAFGTGSVTVAGASGLTAGISSVTLANIFTLNDDLTVSGDNDLTLGGVIDGTGALTKEDDGTLTLSGTNTYSGGTNINAGTVVASGGNAIGDTGTVTIADVDGAKLQLEDDETIGSLAGGTSGVVDLQGHTLTVGDANDTIFEGTITTTGIGDGHLIKQGAGMLTLTGSNVYYGNTTIFAGTIGIGNDYAFGSEGDIIFAGDAGLEAYAANRVVANDNIKLNGHTMTVTGDHDLIFEGTIFGAEDSGAGSIVHDGAGALELNNANTFTGGVTNNSGTLRINNDLAFGTGTLTIGGESALFIQGSSVTLDNTIALNDQLTVASVTADHDLTLDGVVEGTGSLVKEDANTLTLSGDNTYSGGTTHYGGLIAVGSDSALGTGTLTVDGAVSVSELSANVDGVALDNDVILNDDFTVTGSNALTLNGDISGNSSFTKEGDGTLTLNGYNNFIGDTYIAGGIIELAGHHNNGLDYDRLGTGTVIFTGDATLRAIRSYAENHNGVVEAQTNEVWVENSVNLDGHVMTTEGHIYFFGEISGDGNIVHNEGSLYLGNDNASFTGGVTMNGGYLIASSDDSLGTGALTIEGDSSLALHDFVELANNITLNADLAVKPGGYVTELNGVISGEGALVIQDNPNNYTLALTNDNTYEGGTTLNQGVIQVGHDNALGTGTLTVSSTGGTKQLIAGSDGITINNAIVLDKTLSVTGDYSLNLDSVISGTGGLTKEGISTLTLNGQNTYSGDTNINEGTVIASGGDAIGDSSTVTLADVDGATLQLNDDETIGALAGGGSTGGDVSMQDNTLTVGDENNTEFAGVISGTGDLIKQGIGTLTLDGDNTYTGDTTVNGGALIVNGNMASPNMNVASGAMFGGSGYFAGNFTNAGTISPGNSIGTISMMGNLTLTGTSVYDMEIESTAGKGVGNDLIDVDGTADIDGTLNVIGLSGYTPTEGDTFMILEAGGGINGEFSSIVDNLGSFNVEATYTTNDITIELIEVPFTDVVTQPHLAPAAAAFAQIADSNPTGDIATVISQLQTLTDAQLVAAFDQLVPHYLVPQAQATFKGIDVQNNNFNGRLNELRYGLPQLWSNNLQVQTPQASTAEESADPEVAIGLAMQTQQTLEQQQETNRFSGTGKDVWGAWVNGFGTFGDFDSQESQAGFEFNTGGVTLGFDYRVLDTLAAGAFLGYSNTGITVDNGLGTSSFNSINTGMYMTWFNEDGFYASGLFGGGVNFYENNRRIRFGAIDRVAESDPTGFYLQTLATGGYEFKKGNWGIGPQLALQWVNLQIGSHSETGAEDLNLDVGAFNGNSFVTRLGFRATYEYDTSEMLFVPELVGSWEHEYLDPIDTVNVGMPAGGESFSYTGIGTGRDSGLIGVNLIGISHKAPISFTVQYNTEFTPDDFIVSNIYAGVRISF
ncbi:autotransporter-associated beta strand repeat-containing protein [Planctomycetota bacterium]|nr:autotransporter-associated beta strand repeat-containing protein [Planctomycetota bacterium]